MLHCGQYCPHCETITGALDGRAEWWHEFRELCSRCGREIPRYRGEQEADESDDSRLADGFELLHASEDEQ